MLNIMKLKNIEERIAITVWENRISPVFDSARTLLIAEIKDNTLVRTSYSTFDFDRPFELLQILRAGEVRTIICGAISEGPANMFLDAGFELISFIAGDVHRVLENLVKGDRLGDDFKMPGCGKNICCRGKICRGFEIAALNDNDRKRRNRRRRSPTAVTEIGDDDNGSATSTEMSVRLSGEF
jgi:predicted Fe-Mo cluster-binding NifX family protein